jgi:hypothetical protein
MKLTARMLLIDCGRASKKTRGTVSGGIIEGGAPPYQRWGG